MGKKRRIGVEHADQRHALEVVPLCDHLRADEDIDLAGVDIGEKR